MPLTVEQFTHRLLSSGVMSEGELSDWIAAVPVEKRSTDGDQLARELVREKKLTKFQAEQLYADNGNSLTLGNYVILDKLGEGGMGMVLKAWHRRMERTVALKVIAPRVVKDKMALKRFQREVVAAAKLSHPNIVAAYDADEAKGTHFLVMEYVEGADLATSVKLNGPLPVDLAVSCIAQAARGLAYAHEQGVIHRDIKPHNLLLDSKGIVKILDMGLARLEGNVGGGAEHAHLTNSGAIMGTVDYMSPEQAMDSKRADARSDIYSLGCTLFYLLTGRAAFEADTVMKRLTAHQHETPPSLEQEVQTICMARSGGLASPVLPAGTAPLADINAIFQRMVAKQPADRPQSMLQVIAELERCLGNGSTMIAIEPPTKWAMRAACENASADERQPFSIPFEGDEGISMTMTEPPSPKVTAVPPLSKHAQSNASATTESETNLLNDATAVLPPSVSVNSSVATRSKQIGRLIPISMAAVIVILLGLAFTLREKSGTLHLEITDELIEVTIGDRKDVMKGANADEVRLPLGTHVLHIKRGDLAFDSDPVKITEDEPVSILVERVGSQVRVLQGSLLLGQEEPVRPVSSTAANDNPMPDALPPKRLTHYEKLASLDYEWTEPEKFIAPFELSKERELNFYAVGEMSFTGDGLTMFFASDCEGGLGNADLWSASRTSLDASWQSPVNLGANVNSTKNEMRPSVSADGRILIFISNEHIAGKTGAGWIATRPTTQDRFGVCTPLPLPIDYKSHLALSPDGLAIVYVTNDGQWRLAQRDSDTKPFGEPIAMTELSSLKPRTFSPAFLPDGSGLLCLQLKATVLIAARRADGSFLPHERVAFKKLPEDLRYLTSPKFLLDGETLIFGARDESHSLPTLWQMRRIKKDAMAGRGASRQNAAAQPNAKEPAPSPAKAPFDAKQARTHQETWAKHLGTKIETVNSVGAKLILIPPGEFLMGSSDQQVVEALKVAEEIKDDQSTKEKIESEKPQHRVVITKPFFLGATEVTIGQFRQFVEAAKYVTEAEQFGFGDSIEKVLTDEINEGQKQRSWRSPSSFAVTDESPVSQITWNDAVAFCQWISNQEKVTYRLPTEAEWEYACRAGTTTQYSFGDDVAQLEQHGWYNKNADRAVHAAGTKPANPFGLHDMHGNVWEWCQDFFHYKWFGMSPPNDPIGPTSGTLILGRGGSWYHGATNCRSAFRVAYPPVYRSSLHGFRVVRVLDALTH